MLEIRLDAPFDRRDPRVALVEDVLACQQVLALNGGYSRSIAFDRPAEAPRVMALPSADGVSVQWSLFETAPVALRHLVTALRYRGRMSGSPLSLRLERTAAAAAAANAPATQLPAPFELDLLWYYKRLTLELSFSGAFDPAIVPSVDTLVDAWAAFTRMGAFCTQDKVNSAEEDLDVGVEFDPPTVGVDWIAWSLVAIDVPEEALCVLVNLLVTWDRTRRQLARVSIG